jgi:hypothetical protein
MWLCPVPELDMNGYMGNLMYICHQEQEGMKVVVEGDLQRATGPEGKITHLCLPLLSQLKQKRKPLVQLEAVLQGRSGHMLLKNGKGAQGRAKIKKALVT